MGEDRDGCDDWDGCNGWGVRMSAGFSGDTGMDIRLASGAVVASTGLLLEKFWTKPGTS